MCFFTPPSPYLTKICASATAGLNFLLLVKLSRMNDSCLPRDSSCFVVVLVLLLSPFSDSCLSR